MDFQTAHVVDALTNISVAFRNAALVAERVAPVVNVAKQADIYYQFSKQHFRVYDDTYYPGAQAQMIETDLDTRGSYFCQGHALQNFIPDELRANADPGADLDIEYTEKITEGILVAEENNLASKITATALPTGNSTTLSGNSQWSDYLNSNPITAIEAAKTTVQQQIGVFPTTLLITWPIFHTLRNHPVVIDRVKYTLGGVRQMLDASDLAQVFSVNEVIVAAGLKQTVDEGAADNLGYIWGNQALLFYKPERPGLRTPSFMYTFLWTEGAAAYQLKRWREEGIDSDFIKVKKFYDQKIVVGAAAYLWTNVINPNI
jgi:hypothetical protein